MRAATPELLLGFYCELHHPSMRAARLLGFYAELDHLSMRWPRVLRLYSACWDDQRLGS